MKLTMKLFALLFGVSMLANAAYAESPREQLKQMVEQLQKNPSDDALREKIIKLAKTLRPQPSIPDEAERRMVRGTEAFKEAKSATDYQAAATEFQQATLAAPWDGDAYFNLGVAQDKAEQYDAAIHSLKFAQLVSPSKAIQDMIYKIQYQQEKANAPAELAARQAALAARQAASQAASDEALIQRLDGAVFARRLENQAFRSEMEVRINKGYATLSDVILAVTELGRQDGEFPGEILFSRDRDPMPHTGRTFTGSVYTRFSIEVAADGRSLTVVAGNGGADATWTLVKQ